LRHVSDIPTLLARHVPILVYDSQEAYFADSAAIWTDSPTNVLKRADGTVIAKPPTLRLDYLSAKTYPNGQAVQASDMIGSTSRNYAADAKAMHDKPGYANVCHGRSAKDAGGARWLQYWFFYYYNHFELVWPLSAGNHEGDWEMIQIRLDANEQPDLAVYSQHKSGEARPWAEVQTSGDQPYVYVARGSHANYYETGSHWTGTWWDQNDRHGPQLVPRLVTWIFDDPAWSLWPGFWGDTKAQDAIDSTSPTAPCRHAQWGDPSKLAPAAAALKPAKPQLATPAITVTRTATTAKIDYRAPVAPTSIVVGVRATSTTDPAVPHAFEVTAPAGAVEVPVPPDQWVDVSVAAVGADGNATPTALERVAP
jgi:hypothetical protein